MLSIRVYKAILDDHTLVSVAFSISPVVPQFSFRIQVELAFRTTCSWHQFGSTLYICRNVSQPRRNNLGKVDINLNCDSSQVRVFRRNGKLFLRSGKWSCATN